MPAVVALAYDVFREALARRWVLGLGLVITLTLAGVALGLEMEVVDGALAATQFFGQLDHQRDIVPVDVALNRVFEGAAYVVYYPLLVFGVLAFSDFGPNLFAPGRIEHLLSLPVRRSSLLFGTFFGVMAMALIGAVYSAGGFLLIMGVKTGIYASHLLKAGLLAWFVFGALYSAMLTATVFIRSAALSAAVGGGLFVLGIVASFRSEIEPAFSSEVVRGLFMTLTRFMVPVAALADNAAALAQDSAPDAWILLRRLLGVGIFQAAILSLGVWQLERKDY